jgi:hypothetical protein
VAEIDREAAERPEVAVALAKLAAGVGTPADAERLRYFLADSK